MVDQFVNRELPENRDRMLNLVEEQSPAQVFLACLATLILQDRVRFHGGADLASRVGGAANRPRVGVGPVRCDSAVPIGRLQQVDGGEDVLDVWTVAALAEVQELLRRQGRLPLAGSERGLVQQLRQAGVLLGADNQHF